MSYTWGNAVLVAVVCCIATPLYAHESRIDIREKEQHWSQMYWERITAREVRSHEEEYARLYAQLERERARIETRRARDRERLCNRLERLEERYDIDLTLPSYCGGVEPMPTLTLSATPDEVVLGASSHLTWTSTHAVSCVASGGWSGERAISGTAVVTPTETTAYTLECVSAYGTSSKSVTVSVMTPQTPPLVTFAASPLSVSAGETSMLTWSVTDAMKCEASGAQDWVGNKATSSGSSMITVHATTTYTLSCGNSNGTTTKEVEVGVTVPATPPVTVDLIATPPSVLVGSTSVLVWSSTNATYCEASGGAGWVGGKATSGTQEVAVTATTTYMLACGNITGTTTDSVEVRVSASPANVAVNKVVISEVVYDVDATHGVEGDNEWVEIYNGTHAPVDLAGWRLRDGVATDTLSTTSPLMLPAGEYAIVVATGTTPSYWGNFADAALVINLGSANGIGNNLADGGDVLRLITAEGVEQDAVGWEGNLVAFDSTGLVAPAGGSIARDLTTPDSDTVSDWVALLVPTPGT